MTAAIAPSPHPFDMAPTAGAAPARPVRAALPPEVYRRRRLTVLAVVIGLVLGLASFGRSADATPTPEATASEAVLVVVQPGDSLWSIAQSLAPDRDPRPIVAELQEIAGPGALQPGQLLAVPGSLAG